jgi:hypothetical protein
MPLNVRSKPNKLGIVSVSLSVLFWFYVDSNFGPSAFTRRPCVEFVLLPGVLMGASIAAVIAAALGSKWWLLALIGPLSGAMMLSAST